MPVHTAKGLFDKNIRSAETCLGVYDGLAKLDTTLNPKWMLRAAIVFAVSALDTYFHDKIKYRVGSFKLGNLPKQLGNLEIRVSELQNWQKAKRKGNVLREWVTEYLAVQTLQSPQAIAEALKLVNINDFWATAEPDQTKCNLLKSVLNSLIKRRNQIAHEGDRQHSRKSGKRLRSIDRRMVTGWVAFVKHLIEKVEDKFPN